MLLNVYFKFTESGGARAGRSPPVYCFFQKNTAVNNAPRRVTLPVHQQSSCTPDKSVFSFSKLPKSNPRTIMENRLVLEGLDLTDIGSLRRASAWLQEALMEDLEVVPSRGLMTEIELYLGEWIVRTIRNTPDFLLLLEATVRFIDAGTEGGGVNLLRLTANELSHLALAHVLEDPSQNRAEYQAACVISYQRYPMQVNHRQHVEYLRRMVSFLKFLPSQ